MTRLSYVQRDRDDLPNWHRRLDQIGLLVRTVVRLRPAQVAHRIRLRTLRSAEHRWPELLTRSAHPPAGVVPGWPASFSPLDGSLDHGDAAEIAEGTLTFLGEKRSLGEPADWHQRSASRLWRFHLHYAEWTWALVQASDRASARASFARAVAVVARIDRAGTGRCLVPLCRLAPDLGDVRSLRRAGRRIRRRGRLP